MSPKNKDPKEFGKVDIAAAKFKNFITGKNPERENLLKLQKIQQDIAKMERILRQPRHSTEDVLFLGELVRNTPVSESNKDKILDIVNFFYTQNSREQKILARKNTLFD